MIRAGVVLITLALVLGYVCGSTESNAVSGISWLMSILSMGSGIGCFVFRS